MGILPGRHDHARHCDDPHRVHDRRKPQTGLCRCAGLAASLILWAVAAQAEPLRIAIYNTDLHRAGPGVMLRDILRQDPEPLAIAKHIAKISPDIIVLQNIDYDSKRHGLTALRDLIAKQGGLEYRYLFAPRPNTGIPTGVDVDSDGTTHSPRDAQGYGTFPGQRGLAVLSRYPIDHENVQTFTEALWNDVALADPKLIPPPDILGQDVRKRLRLSSTAHVAIPVLVSGRQLMILTHHATPPMFDGPKDRNGFRNAAENLFWLAYLKGSLTEQPPKSYVLAALANIDPDKGQGHRTAISHILQSPQFNDPLAKAAPANRTTVQWNENQSSAMRVSYLLPSPNIPVIAAGNEPNPSASRHHLIWIDIDF